MPRNLIRRTGATTMAYNNADMVTSSTAQGLTTSTEYNTSLRGWRVTQPDFGKVTNEFYLTGQLKKTFGVRTYPVEYTYDYAGRMATMKTWTNYPSGTPAVTTWQYDGNRGWLTGKYYANATTGAAQTSSGTTYTYKPSGRLLTRKWARGTPQLVTTYGYNGAGDMASVDYSDSTPDVTYGYDRRGRQTSMAQVGGTTTTRAFNDAGQMIGESYAGGPLNGMSVTNVFDGLLRRTNVSVLSSPSSVLSSHAYAYNAASGRLQTVTDDLTPGTLHSATYSYLANSPLVNQIVFKQNSTTRMTTTKSYDLLNRLTSISSAPSASSAVGFIYSYNNAGQRYQVTHAEGGINSQWLYQYDVLGQLTSGGHRLGGIPLAGQQFGYAFDTIGNRKSALTGGDGTTYGTTRQADYSVNLLNQYTTRTVPGYVEVIGVATNLAAKLWVNKQEPMRQANTYFRKELTVANSGGPVWLGITNLAILNQGSNPDIIATNKGNVLVPMSPESFTYDLDGNLTSDSLWVNTWNAENRRVVIESSVSSGTGVPAVARAREVWTHLPDGRWIERIVSTNNGSSYVPVFTNRYVWDGNVLLAVLNNVNAVELAFMRGLDLSGTLQGAGGVGGLLAVFSPSAINSQPSTHFAAYDGNGNVTMLVNAADGTESARYEYGPFAEPLRMTGPMAKINPIRFSTQYADDVCGDIKYLYRDYTAGTGRWRSRDPVEERGGDNLLSFVFNDPISFVDPLGLAVKQTIKDSSGNVLGYVFGDIINCAGYGCSQGGGLNLANGSSWDRLLKALGYKCTSGVAAKDCKKHCNCENYIEFYLYIHKGIDYEKIKKQLGDRDPMNLPPDVLKSLELDYHTLRGEGGDGDGSYTFVGHRYPINNPVIENYPSAEYPWPDYFEPDQLVSKACCCKK